MDKKIQAFCRPMTAVALSFANNSHRPTGCLTPMGTRLMALAFALGERRPLSNRTPGCTRRKRCLRLQANCAARTPG
jgi:hypothetical protein